MNVIKRSGKEERVSFDKILKRYEALSDGLHVNANRVAQKVIADLVDGIKTSQLDEIAGQVASSMVSQHPDYGILAARIVVSNLQKNTYSKFSQAMLELKKFDIVQIDVEAKTLRSLDKHIRPERDFQFDYFGLKTLERSYLLQHEGKVVETPQYMWMRVAMGMWGENVDNVLRTYELLSQGYFTHATPTLFNAGTPRPQLSSCFLSSSADSVEGLYDSVKECAQISKYAGGIGIHCSMIRSKGAYIKGTNGYSTGLIPFMRVLNNTALHINQAGKRNGSIAVYLEPWHADVEDFLELKKNTGSEELRARDLFLALWLNDVFRTRVEQDADWTLMDPNECPGLAEAHGDKFRLLYEGYEKEGKGRKTIPARQLWFQILESQIETGVPYLLNKDAVNAKNNQANLGTIKSSNLCVAPETKILTKNGIFPIYALKDSEVKVWNGEEWSLVTVRKTGENQKLMRVTVRTTIVNYSSYKDTENVLDCTYYHKFVLADETRVEAQCLEPGSDLLSWKQNVNSSYPILVLQKVIKIEKYGRSDDTYCFSEPNRQMGVFNGILTGNCAEIVEYSDEKETAVCNLASLALNKFVVPSRANQSKAIGSDAGAIGSDAGAIGSDAGANQSEANTVSEAKFDFSKLREVVAQVTANLDKVIDINFYPVEKARLSNMRHRPIGLGVQGLADAYALMKFAFDSPEAAALNREIFENIYYSAVDTSIKLAAEHGSYDTFKGSPASEGKLQCDLWNDQPRATPYLDWEGLRTRIKTGLRNSLLVALMPTASTSQILGNNECFEPFTSNLYVRRVLAGEFVIINKHLVRDLMECGLWTTDMQQKIMSHSGRVKDIAEIPEAIRDRYKTVWDIRQKVLIDQARDRAPFICQSQSMNLFFERPSIDVMSSALFYAWKQGLKTLSYYIRSKPVANNKAFQAECTTCSA